MDIMIFMMQKNEEDLLPLWVSYHAEIAGYENIHIIDNGSTTKTIADILSKAEELGVRVYRNFSSDVDYEEREKIISNLIRDYSAAGRVLFPMDCDEFIALRDGDVYLCDSFNIITALKNLSEGIYYTCDILNNCPWDSETFLPKHSAYSKVILKTPVFSDLAKGFHNVSGGNEQIFSSNLVYFHLHNKPYQLLRQHAREKLALRVDTTNKTVLQQYRGAGSDLINYFLDSETQWLYKLKTSPSVKTSSLSMRFKELHWDWPFSGQIDHSKKLLRRKIPFSVRTGIYRAILRERIRAHAPWLLTLYHRLWRR